MAEIKNRRRGPDTMVRMITYFSIASWLLIIGAFVVNQITHVSGSSYGAVRQTLLDFSTGRLIAKVLLSLNILVSLWGMMINAMRNKRRSDRFHLSLIISAAISLVALILMMVFL